jgi:hypothetical protein
VNDEEAQLARRACGDIPAAYCHVVGVQINGDTGTVWLLTNGPREFEEYEVEFERRGGAWHEGAGHGGFPDRHARLSPRSGGGDDSPAGQRRAIRPA